MTTPAAQPLPPPAAAPPVATPPGWYPDPWGVAAFRWWNGHAWAANVAPSRGDGGGEQRRPRLPAWLSVPVLVAGGLAVPFVVLSVVLEPIVLALVLVPLVFIVPVLAWIDRLEPEPRASRLHAFLWGATVAILGAGVVNSIVLVSYGETATAVISAPLVEETLKGLGILWAVRRTEVDGVVDGIVYAGWVAAGFAMVENIEYFLVASDDGVLAETFVLRALLTPFAHPLFTMWIGLAIGLAVARGSKLPWTALWGWVIAVGLHAGWNGAIVASVDLADERILLVAARLPGGDPVRHEALRGDHRGGRHVQLVGRDAGPPPSAPPGQPPTVRRPPRRLGPSRCAPRPPRHDRSGRRAASLPTAHRRPNSPGRASVRRSRTAEWPLSLTQASAPNSV